LSGFLLAAPLPQQGENFTPIEDRGQNQSLIPQGRLQQLLHLPGSRTREIQPCVGVEDLGLGHRAVRPYSIRCSRSRASTGESSPSQHPTKAVDELVGDEPENERLLFGAIDTEVRAFLKVLKANILRNNAFS